MTRGSVRLTIVFTAMLGSLGLTSIAAADPSCTSVVVRGGIAAPGPFGETIVAPTARSVEPNFGQAVLVPEAPTKCP